VRRKEQLLDSLNHDSPFTRVNNIPRCSAGTFEWIFDGQSPNRSDQAMSSDSLGPDMQVDELEGISESKYSTVLSAKTQLRKWLYHGEGVFWIKGKPGSGKSTLMKFLAGLDNQNPRTLQCLKNWAGTQNPRIVSFYFWLSDTNGIQNSFHGFLCHLLYQILSIKSPEFVASLLTEERLRQKKNLGNWDPEELEGLLMNVACQVAKETPLSFMIDSLDECTAADQDRVIDVIKGLVLQIGSKIKVCVSSRPEQRIENRLQRLKPQILELHYLTGQDIRRHVTEELDSCWRDGLSPTEKEKHDLISKLVQNSEGVFLWAFLVARELCKSIEYGDTISQLHRQLEELPYDMTNLYVAMLKKADATKGHRLAEAASYFKFAIHFKAIQKSVLREATRARCRQDNIDLFVPLYERHNGKINVTHRAARRLMRQRINSLCAGILVTGGLDHGYSGTVDFFHRTARDFFCEPAGNGILEHCKLTLVDILCLNVDGVCRNGYYPCDHELNVWNAREMIDWLHTSEMKNVSNANKVKYLHHVNESMSRLYATKNSGIKGDWVWQQSKSPGGDDEVLDFTVLSLSAGSIELLSQHRSKNPNLSTRYKDYLLLCWSQWFESEFFISPQIEDLYLELGANPNAEFYWGMRNRLKTSPWLRYLSNCSDVYLKEEIVEAFLANCARLDDRTILIQSLNKEHGLLRTAQLESLTQPDVSPNEGAVMVIEVNAKYLLEDYYSDTSRRNSKILSRLDVQQTESYQRVLLVRPGYTQSGTSPTEPICDLNELYNLNGVNNSPFPENQQQFAEVGFEKSEELLENIVVRNLINGVQILFPEKCNYKLQQISDIWQRSPKVNLLQYLEEKGHYKPADDPAIPQKPIPMYNDI
jgi:energy-coupling factor transporter ATP-binding protein EcfA2